MNPAIVVVAFNRPKSLTRILDSISKANYYEYKNIELIISIDKGDNKEVLKIANQFLWEFGNKTVIYQDKNLGLRSHILKCGNLTKKYRKIILLEDDLYVSPEFYDYACKALKFSDNNKKIGGISLYNHKINVLVNEPFSVNEDGYDNWYFQFASSWGQAWNYNQWNEFIKWYENNKNNKLEAINFPKYVSDWPNSSWLKFYTKYLVENNKYFLYPKISLTTNFSDKGTHVGSDNTDFQVQLQSKICREYRFSEISESNSIYDVFFENEKLANILGIENNNICIDLYGYKVLEDQKYYLTRKILNYKIIKSFGCCMRPHDMNIICSIEGKDFFLYDTHETSINNSIIRRDKDFRKIRYIFFAKTKEQYLSLFKMLCIKFMIKSKNLLFKKN